MSEQFPLLNDRRRFPLVAGGDELVVSNLLGCDGLAFAALTEPALATVYSNKPGRQWDEYGDTRWPWFMTWVECPLPSILGSRRAGVLTAVLEIPPDEPEALLWAAENHPLATFRMEMRDPDMLSDLWHGIDPDAAEVSQPTDKHPAFIQGYTIFVEGDSGTEVIACYTDLLNSAGIPLVAFRVSTASDFLPIKQSQFVLHSLFLHNEARRNGVPMTVYHQLPEVAPLPLPSSAIPPQWARFHPTRTMRSRPALRSEPSPRFQDGYILISDYERLLDVRRREVNLHNLAFDREARSRDMVRLNNDGNISMTTFIHRAEGGSIFLLPAELVEEFYNTDCDEVRLADLKFPFRSLFLSFTPPEPLNLSAGQVDGCYVCRQDDEVLFVLTTCLPGVDYERSLSVTTLDPTMSLHLPIKDLTMPLNQAVEAGIADFLEKNAPPEDDKTQTVTLPNGMTTTIMDVRATNRRRRIEEFRNQEPAFRACLNIVVNAMCFIEFRPDDISEEWAGEPPAELLATASLPPTTRRAIDRAAGAKRRLREGDYTRVKVCGRQLLIPHGLAPGTETGPRPRSHWRRGHWRRQRHGEGLTLIGLRWIRPTLVNRGVGTPAEARIYSV